MEKFKNFLSKYINSSILTFFDKLLYRLSEHEVSAFGASLTYFFVLSIFPFIIAFINVINLSGVFSTEPILNALDFLPTQVEEIVLKFLGEISSTSSGLLLFISIIAGILSASKAINQIIKRINRFYNFKENRNIIVIRLLAFIFTIAFMLMIILLSITQVFGEMLFNGFIDFFNLNKADFAIFWILIKNIIPIIYMLLTFIILYKYSPSSPQKKLLTFKSILPGSIFSTVMVIVATSGFGYYVSNFGKYSITYGSLGGIIIFLIWLYLMSFIILIGAEINATLFSMQLFKTQNLWPRHESVVKNIID